MHTNGSPLSLARSLNSNDHSPRNTTGLPSRSPAGFLLLDSSLRPVSFNAEAIHVLSYPDTLANIRRPDVFLAGKIHSSLMTQPSSRESPFVTEFRSGRRRYLCRVMFVDWNANGHPHPSMAVLLERAPSGLIPVALVSEHFNLTRRERDVLEYLLHGLSTKEIANRMGVSPNTVKAFLRLIMSKTGASSRSAIMSKIIMSSSGNPDGSDRWLTPLA